MLSSQILKFLFNLKLPFTLKNNVEVLDVFKLPAVKQTVTTFYNKFYNDANERYMFLGINPGRFGSGITGVPFTDPIRLQTKCGIENNFVKKQELSSVFMYEMMEAFGGVEDFYNKIFISSVSPLGFVHNGKNLNYYDDKYLKNDIVPFVVSCIKKELKFGINRNVCFCIGEGENFKFLTALNDQHNWFKQIVALPHPRFIMQYKLKQKSRYAELYIEKIRENIT